MITCYFENGSKDSLRHVTVAVIIVKGKKVLLGKRGTLNGKPILESGKWALIGGFVDRDETFIEAAKREVMEETRLQIDNLKLFRIVDNPNRPNEDRQNISVVFVATSVKGTSEINEETTDLDWFDLDNLPPKEQIAFDFYDCLELYKKYLKEEFPIPVLG